MAQTNNKDVKAEAILPVLATAMLQGAGADNNDLQALVAQLLKDQLNNREKEQAKKERMQLSALQATAEATLAKKQQESRCSHEKQDGTTRLVGQRLTGTKQIALVCQFCQKEYFSPPLEDQEAPPRHLIPQADAIGG